MYGTGSYFRDENCVPNYECYQQYVPFSLLFVVLFRLTLFIFVVSIQNGLLLYTNINDLKMRWPSVFL